MSKEELKYIFSESHCLTPRQMKRYVRGLMPNDESYAVELHLNSCAFCNEAVEGLFEQREGSAAEAVTQLNSDFLKDHFSLHQPKVHLNSMAPAHPVAPPAPTIQPRKRRKFHTETIWKPSSLAAALLIGIGIIWFAKQREQLKTGQAATASVTVVQQAAENPQPSGNDRVLASADLVEVKDDPVPLQQMAATSGEPLQAQQQQPLQLPQPVLAQQKDIQPVAAPKPAEAKTKASAMAQPREETVATQYKAPVAENHSPVTAQRESVEQMPARASEPVASTAAGVYSEDGSTGASADRRKEAETSLSADDLYDQKKYSAALALYKQQMNAGGRGKRNYAALQAARCHLALGNKQSAIQLLQSIVSEGGTHKRAAKRLLEELGVEKGE